MSGRHCIRSFCGDGSFLSSPSMTMIWVVALTWALALASSSSSSSSTSYNPYHYDRTTPQFTPDGRLLQVEYATAAADHSYPVVFLWYNDTMGVFVAVRSKPSNFHRLAILNSQQQQQSGQSSSFMDAGNPGSSVVIGMSGVVADNIALLQRIQDEQRRHWRLYQEPYLTARQVARVIGDACQQHSFGGGIRPYGSAMITCGISNSHPSPLFVARTDPSGAVHEFDRHQQQVYVQGGSYGLRTKLQKDLQDLWQQQQNDESNGQNGSLSSLLMLATRHLLRAVESTSPLEQAQPPGKRRSAAVAWPFGASEKSTTFSTSEKISLEVAVVSTEHGVYQLTESQTKKLWSQCQDDSST